MMIRLPTRVVEKPWGRIDIPSAFGEFGNRRIGEIWFEDPDGAAAPLMVKFLFTSERLSIQVHPGNDAAKAAGLQRGKDECWLVLDAMDGAELGVGVKAPSSAEALREAALDGSIVSMIDWRSAAVGDFIYNSAGTIHAIGSGLIIAEVQQNVDCTYRLYDHGRGRELNLEDGLAVVNQGARSAVRDTRVAAFENRLLVDGPHFSLLHLAGPEADEFLPNQANRYTLIPLSEGCTASGETVALGEGVIVDRADSIRLEPNARALLCWPN